MMQLGQRANAWQVSEAAVDMSRTKGSSRLISLDAEPQSIVLDMEKAAVIVIDMQNDFCSPGGWLDFIGVDVSPLATPLPLLKTFLPSAREQGLPILWVNWGNRTDKMNLSPCVLHIYNPTGMARGIGDLLPNGSAVLTKGSWGAAVVDELPAEAEDIFIDKYRISGFWDTPLDSILRTLGKTTLFFCGVNTDQCVMATLQDASFLGYDCILLSDCVATTSPAYCVQATLYNVKQCFGFVTTGAAVLQAMTCWTTGEQEEVLHEPSITSRGDTG